MTYGMASGTNAKRRIRQKIHNINLELTFKLKLSTKTSTSIAKK